MHRINIKKEDMHKPSDPKATNNMQCKLTDRQYYYLKSRALLEGKEIQVIVRQLIERAYDNELRNGVDAVQLAIDNGLL